MFLLGAEEARAAPLVCALTGHVARVRPGQPIGLPDAPYLHVFVARGEAALEGVGPLAAGDAVRISGGGGQQVTTRSGAEIMVWEMHAALGSPAA